MRLSPYFVSFQGSLNFFLPSIILRRLHQKKLDLFSTIKCRHLKNRIMSNYTSSKDGNFTFVLYNNSNGCAMSTSMSTSCGSSATGCDASSTNNTEINSYNVLKKILKEDGCTLVTLEGKVSIFLLFCMPHCHPYICDNVYSPQICTKTMTNRCTFYIFCVCAHRRSRPFIAHACIFIIIVVVKKYYFSIREHENNIFGHLFLFTCY